MEGSKKERVIEWLNMIKVHYMHVWKCNYETLTMYNLIYVNNKLLLVTKKNTIQQ
jgi:hypothetical protein